MKLMEFGISKFVSIFDKVLKKVYMSRIDGDYILNINKDVRDSNQKNVLLCYTLRGLKTDINENVTHANVLHSLQMLKVLINHGYSVDLFLVRNITNLDLLKPKYDLIIGFGPIFEKIIGSTIKGVKILFLTENDPKIVNERYEERIQYYIERHGNKKLSHNIPRNTFYSEKQLLESDIIIGMNSDYNLKFVKRLNKPLYKINSNALINKQFIFNKDNASKNKKNFVWFGSNGIIHKGVDILVDAFKELPDCNLSLYGIPKKELPVIKDFLSPNIKVCDRIDVTKPAFINDVLFKHAFVIFASCSEGMNTGVATCMIHGMIPVITRETGFDNPGFIFEFSDFYIENIINTVKNVSSLDDEYLNEISERVYNYSREKFSLDLFTERFDEILSDIEQNNQTVE